MLSEYNNVTNKSILKHSINDFDSIVVKDKKDKVRISSLENTQQSHSLSLIVDHTTKNDFGDLNSKKKPEESFLKKSVQNIKNIIAPSNVIQEQEKPSIKPNKHSSSVMPHNVALDNSNLSLEEVNEF